MFSTSWQGYFKVLTKVRSLRGSAKQLRLATGDCQPRPEAEQSITLLPTAPATFASHPKHFVHRRSRLFSCHDTLRSFTLATSPYALLELRLFGLCLYIVTPSTEVKTGFDNDFPSVHRPGDGCFCSALLNDSGNFDTLSLLATRHGVNNYFNAPSASSTRAAVVCVDDLSRDLTNANNEPRIPHDLNHDQKCKHLETHTFLGPFDAPLNLPAQITTPLSNPLISYPIPPRFLAYRLARSRGPWLNHTRPSVSSPSPRLLNRRLLPQQPLRL